MSTGLNDRSASALSDMAYFADKLKQLKDISKYDNVGKVFYNDNGTLRTEFKNTEGKEIPELKEYAQRINDNREMYNDILSSKLIGTADDDSGYKGIAVRNSDGSVTIASAGTDSVSFMDSVSDFQMAMGKVPLQLDSAKKFINDLKTITTENGNPFISVDTPIDLTGHSLGGSLSQLLAIDLVNDGNIRGVKAFESAGIRGVIENTPELAEKYYANQTLIDGMIKSYVSELDPVVNWARQIGTITDAFSKDGIYTQQSMTKGGYFYHKLDRYETLAYDPEGNIIQGQINYKNLLKAMRDEPANLEKHLTLYDAIKGFEPYDPSGKSSLDNFVSDCLAYKVIDKLFSLTGTSAMLNTIMAVNSQYKSAKAISVTPPRRDPITVDLDNDGIETTDTAGGVHFDLDGNGTREKTSWVNADDGLLVMDRNENNTIDSGRELFGDQTIIKTPDGKQKTAETGFEALSAEDSNNDKVIDTSDKNFSKLKIWQDKNQDGISQADELQSLTGAGIEKIHLDYLTVNTDDGHENIQTRTSGFEFADGRTGQTGEFLFNRDTIDTHNSDFSNIPADILSMPYLRGFGQVTDLYHAMGNDSALKTLVQEFVELSISNIELPTSTSNNQPSTDNYTSILLQKFESILFRWAGVDAIDEKSRGGNFDARKLGVLEKLFAENFEGFGASGTVERSANPNAAAATQLNTVYNNIRDNFFANILLQSHLKEYVILGAVELQKDGTIKVNDQTADAVLKTVDYQKPLTVNSSPLTTSSDSNQVLTENYQLLSLKFFALTNTVKALGSAEEREEFVDYFASKHEDIYADGLRGLSPRIIIGNKSNDSLNGNKSDNIIYGLDGNDTITGAAGDDTLSGGSGNDTIYGDNTNEFENPDVRGNDILSGGKGDDYLSGGFGNDTYIYRRGDGNDTIFDYNHVNYGGRTSDKLKLMDMNPSDIFSTIRSGNNFILTFKDANGNAGEKITFKDWFSGDDPSNRLSNYKIEEIEFSDGTKWDVAQIEENILILGTDKNDKISGSIVDDMILAGNGNDTINSNKGNDTVFAGSGDDTVNAEDENDVVNGEDGNDTITGGAGDDTVSGGSGNDTIYGDNTNEFENPNVRGNDTLDGGKGDDYLSGGFGNDTYIYRKGDGNDTIFDYNHVNYGGRTSDKLKLMEMNPSDIFSTIRSGNNFILTFKDANGNAGEKITFKDWFSGDGPSNRLSNYKIEEIEFSDGTKWDVVDMERAYKETITGTDNADKLGGKDNHGMIIDGKNGNDVLESGKNDDYLSGGEGSDTYIYSRGDGNDTIFDENSLKTNQKSFDKLKLEKINPDDVESITRDYANLTIAFKATDTFPGKKIIFKDWFLGDTPRYAGKNFKMEEIEFADGTKWNVSDIERKIQVTATENNDEIYGSSSNDTIHTKAGDDEIHAGDGDDSIYGEEGDDILFGEKGNDTLVGGEGSDTYVYRRGDGKDVINDFDDLKSGSDSIIKAGFDFLLQLYNNIKRTFYDIFGIKNDYNDDDTKKEVLSFDKLKLEGIVKEDIREMVREKNDLIIQFKESDENSNSIRIKSWFTSGEKNNKIEEIEFADGTKWGVTDVERSYKETVTGTDSADRLKGKSDHGMIIEGKKGNDTITGGAKEDIYVVNPGDGNDVIKTTGGGEDIIRVNASSDSLSFKKMNENDMVMFLRNVNGSSSLTLTGYLDQQKHETQKIKQIETMSDGAILTEKNLQLLVQAIASFETEKGIAWEKAVEQNDPKTKEILSQYWSYEKKSGE